MAAIIHHPKLRITELVNRFGGYKRSEAVANAHKELEALRGAGDEVLENSIGALETVVDTPTHRRRYSKAQLRKVLCLGDQIVTLAGTFGYTSLDQAARSLCDVADGLMRTERADVASIKVHMRTLRLVSPRAPQLSEEQTSVVFSELSKVLAHHGFDRFGASANTASFEQRVPDQ